MLHILVHSAAAWRTNFFNQALRLRRPHHLLSEPGYVLNCMSGWQVKTRTILGKLGMHCHPNHDPHCPEHLPHKPNLILYPSHPHPYPNFSLCLPRQQSGDPHTFILFEECFFHLPNSPETWFSLWLLFFLQIAQAVAIFKDTFFFFYTPCTWLKIFLFASHCHFQTMSPHFLEVGVRSVGISPIPLRLRLPDLNTTPSLSSGDLCHSSPCLGRQLLAVNLCIFINSCHNNRQLQPSTWLFNISWYYVVIVSCSKCDQVVWIFFFLRILVFYRGFLIYLQI